LLAEQIEDFVIPEADLPSPHIKSKAVREPRVYTNCFAICEGTYRELLVFLCLIDMGITQILEKV
jgi:hypothetical protein